MVDLTATVQAIRKQLDDFTRVVQQSGNLIKLAGKLIVSDGISFPGRVNLLTNGGMEIWQRGAGPMTVSGAYTADHWNIDLTTYGTGTISVTKETSTIDGNGTASAKIVATVSSGRIDFQQANTENMFDFYGKTLSFSIRVKTDVANAVRPWIWDSSGGGTFTYGDYHPGDGSWQTLTVTRTVLPNAIYGLYCGVSIEASCTLYVDNAMLVPGSTPADYYPLNPVDERLRCLRYYEIQFGVVNTEGWELYAGGAMNIGTRQQFSVQKLTAPTVTISGTWAVVNCGQPWVYAPAADGYTLGASATAAGRTVIYCDSTDDVITSEAES